MKTQRLLALVPVALIVACGGSSEFAKRPGPSIALDSLPEEFAKAQCDAFERCAGLYYNLFFTLEECSTLVSRQFRDGGFTELEQAIDDGRVKYDSRAAAKCIDVISERECEDFDQRDIPECEDAVKGTVPADGECEIDAECEGSRICVVDMCPANGTCQDRGGAGTPCSDDDDCANDFVCHEATSLCARPKQDGETCGGNVEAQCEGGLACQGESKDDMQTGTCTPFDELTTAGLNETCDLDAGILCDPDLSCTVVALEGPAFQCKAIPISGGNCGLGIPENCPAGEYCDLSAAEVVLGTFESTCLPLPASGEPCVDRNPFNGILAQCEAYARCDTSTGNCLALRDLGETCSASNLCYSQNCVNGGCAAERACP